MSDGQGGEVTATVDVTVTGVTPRTIFAARLDSAQIFDVSGDGALHSITGTAFNDTLIGGAGNETLNGGGGGDLMTGALGDDSYYIDDVADQVIEQAGQGSDSVRSTLNSYALGDHVEKLLFAGTGDFEGTGNGLDNHLTGGAGNDSLTGLGGNDTLNGGAGDDLMAGGEGSDSYYVGASSDQIVEHIGQGIDTVRATAASYGLGDHLEKLVFAGTGDFAGSGNGLNNTLTGGAGEDTLTGLGGNDRLFGGNGNDVLIGGAGSDHLTGEAGRDTFRFDHLGVSSERDSVRDFAAGEDRIEIDRSAFTAFAADAAGMLAVDAFLLGTKAQTANQHIIYNATNGVLYYDADGAGGLAQIQIAAYANHANLTAGDIFLI
nr:calcium-binding protein [Asticcacaulis biprosthecium]